MTISIERRWNDVSAVDGVSDNDDHLEVTYILRADDNEDESNVLTFVQNSTNIPHAYLGLFIRNVQFGRHEDTEEYWLVVATYASGTASWTIPKLDVDEVWWAITGGAGESRRRTYSDSLISETLPAGATSPTLTATANELAMGLVHRDGDFEIDGIELPVGGTRVAVRTVWDHAGAITAGRLLAAAEYNDLYATNSVAWKIFEAGTLQIEDFNASYRPGTNPTWDVSFTLLYSKNLTNIDVGNGIVVPSKKGHEILDVLYMKKQVDGLPLPVPVRAAVHAWTPSVNFTTVLGL